MNSFQPFPVFHMISCSNVNISVICTFNVTDAQFYTNAMMKAAAVPVKDMNVHPNVNKRFSDTSSS